MLQQLIIDHIDLWTSAETSRSTAGRGNNGKTELTGIKKLRELILELAVRGLLVPQDPNDEPASVLLEKITAEKAELIKAGKIKKQQPLPAITEDEKSFALPDTWEWVRMGNVVDIVRGITFPASEKSKTLENGRVACLRTTNVQNEIEWGDMLFIREQYVSRGEQYIKKSDIVMSMANSRELVGKVAIVHDEPKNKTSFGGFLSVLRPRLVSPFYLMALLRVPTNKNTLIDSASQTTNIANISLGKLNPLVLALPPLPEQHRIVAKVDELMALCDQLEQQQLQHSDTHHTLVTTLLNRLSQATDNAQFQAIWSQLAAHFDSLFSTEASIDQLKQTLLQLAVMGKLVPQDPNDEPASVLLEKTAVEKAAFIKAGKIKKQNPLPEIAEDEKPFDLPDGWEWVRFGDLVNIKAELVKPDKFQSYDQVAPDTIEKGTGRLLSRRTVRDSGIRGPNSRFYKGQILYSKIRPSLSKMIIAEFDGLCSADMYPLESLINPQYLLKNMLSEVFLVQVRIAENRIKMPKLNIESLSNILIPLASSNEQHRIVAKVDELMALCDQLKAGLNQAQTTQQQLAHALVEQAIQ